MACLSYKPNPITLKNGIKFERNDVFAMQENAIKLLEKLNNSFN